jgi:sugar phosphate isomerase/epimerase
MIYITLAGSCKKKLNEAIIELNSSGFKNIELTGSVEYCPDYEKTLLDLKEKHRLNYLVHNYFPPPDKSFVLNFCSENKETYEMSLKLIKKALNLCKVLGLKHYSFHPGYCLDLENKKQGKYFKYTVKEKPKAFYEELFYNRFDKLIKEIEGEENNNTNDIIIAVENLFPFNENEDYSLLSSPEEIMKFLEKYSHKENIGLLLDLGHLNIASNYLGFDKYTFLDELFNKFSHKIFEIHMSGNNGTVDNHSVNEIDSWQIKFLEKNHQKIKNIPITLEWHDSTSKNNFKKKEEILKLLKLN